MSRVPAVAPQAPRAASSPPPRSSSHHDPRSWQAATQKGESKIACGRQRVGMLCCEFPMLHREHLPLHLLRLRMPPLFRQGASEIACGDERVHMLCPEFPLLYHDFVPRYIFSTSACLPYSNREPARLPMVMRAASTLTREHTHERTTPSSDPLTLAQPPCSRLSSAHSPPSYPPQRKEAGAPACNLMYMLASPWRPREPVYLCDDVMSIPRILCEPCFPFCLIFAGKHCRRGCLSVK